MCLTKNCEYCAQPFTAKRSTAHFCSEKCKKVHQRTTTSNKRLTPRQKLENSSFMLRLVSACVRSGTVAILPRTPEQWAELYDLHCRAAILNYSLPDGETVALSHFCPASKRGVLTARNLGVWPAKVNNQFQDKLMPYGVQVSRERWNDKTLKVSSSAQARTLIIKLHGRTIEALRPTALPLTNIARQVKDLMKKSGIAFDKLISMSKAELLALLNKYGITRDEVKPAVFASTLANVHQQEIGHQIKLYGDTANGQALQQFQQLTREYRQNDEHVDEDEQPFDPYLLYGSLAITGHAADALKALQEDIQNNNRQPTVISASDDYDEEDEMIELDDGTVIFSFASKRNSAMLNDQCLYNWYVKSKHYDRKKSITSGEIRSLYDNSTNQQQAAA